MHIGTLRILIVLFIAGIMTTCLSLYLSTTSRKFVQEFSTKYNSPMRLRHFTALKSSSNEISVDKPDFMLVIHGGAGVVSKEIDSKPFYDALTRIMTEAYRFAKAGKTVTGINGLTALDLVEFTVKLLENDPLFNAGKGAVFTADETHEMEASIMNGSNLQCGAVSLINTVKNPISLARAVMEKTPHNYMIGEAAEKLAIRESLERMDKDYFSTDNRKKQLLKAKEIGVILNDHDLEDKKNILNFNQNIDQINEKNDKHNNNHNNNQKSNQKSDQRSDQSVDRIVDQRTEKNSEEIPNEGKISSSILFFENNQSLNSLESSIKNKKINVKSVLIDSITVTDYPNPNYTSNPNSPNSDPNLSPNIFKNNGNDNEKNRVINDIKEIDSDMENRVESDFPGGTGTVGCVCMYLGHIAAATSTGGLTNKLAGRIGDTPIIGAGTYANDETCAVSTTGKGEEFMRYVAAHDVSARIEIGGMSLERAVKETVFKKLPTGSGGLIAVNTLGEYSMEFNSRGMFRGVCDSSGQCSIGIWEELIPFHVSTGDNSEIPGSKEIQINVNNNIEREPIRQR